MLQNLGNDKLIITQFCLQHIYSLIILWLFIYICRYILLIDWLFTMQILHNLCWYCYRILWLFMIIWWYGFERRDFIDYFHHNRSDMINHDHHYLIIVIYIISHGSILCSLCFINCRSAVAISNCTPLGATWWETFHWGLTCVKWLTTGELAPNEALFNNMSMAQCWLDCDHFVWFFFLYFGLLCFMRLLYLLPTPQTFISFWMDTPLHNNALFQCWIKFILYTNHSALSQSYILQWCIT